MKKLIITLLVLALLLVALTAVLLAKSDKNISKYSHTKAICNENNYCQDYYITCEKNKIVMMMPITGAAIQQESEWTDPRTEEQKKLCG